LVLRVLLVLPLPFVLGVLVVLVVLHFLDCLLVLEDLVNNLVVVVGHLKVQLEVNCVTQIMFGLVLGDQLPAKVIL
jgi:hypothetical protein